MDEWIEGGTEGWRDGGREGMKGWRDGGMEGQKG